MDSVPVQQTTVEAHGLSDRHGTQPQRETPGWQELRRAREILDAEYDRLRTERSALQKKERALKHYKESLASREQLLSEREALVSAAESGVLKRRADRV